MSERSAARTVLRGTNAEFRGVDIVLKNLLLVAAAASATAVCTAAPAYEAGDWMGRLGAHYVDPRSDNHDIVSVEGATAVTAAMTYFVTPTVGLDLLVALPFEHDIELVSGGGRVGSVQHLPPTLSLAWFPRVSDSWQPYFGAGLNYTLFIEERTRGALSGTRLKLEDSAGLALMTGLMFRLTPEFSLTVDIRHFDIDTEAKLDGASLGDVHIDPWGYGASIAYHF